MANNLDIRGQEAEVTITVEGVKLQIVVDDFSHKPNYEVVERDHLGETATDDDMIFHNHKISFSSSISNAEVARYIQLCEQRNAAGQAPPRSTVVCKYTYRNPGQKPLTKVFTSMLLVVSEDGVGGRKDYQKASFDGTGKTMLLMNQ